MLYKGAHTHVLGFIITMTILGGALLAYLNGVIFGLS